MTVSRQVATPKPLTLPEDLELCRRLGCGLEIAEKYSAARDQLAYIRESGVRLTSIQPRTLAVFPAASAPLPDFPDAKLENLIASVDLFSKYWQGFHWSLTRVLILMATSVKSGRAAFNTTEHWHGALL